MNKAFKNIYRGLRTVIVTLLILAVVLFVTAYVALSLPSVQKRVKTACEKAVSEYLDTKVSIGKLTIKPFNQVILHDVNIPGQNGDSLLNVEKLGAGIDIYKLIKDKRIVVTYGEIFGLQGHITRPDKDSTTNIQFIIDAFKPKDNEPPKPFDVQVFNVVIRRSALTYDVINEPQSPPGTFDPNHLAISDLKADLVLPRLKNNDFDIQIKRLSFNEKSGFSLKKLATRAIINDTTMHISDTHVTLPNSRLDIGEMSLSYSSLKNLGKEIETMPLSVNLNSTLSPSDLSAFVPSFRQWNNTMDISAAVNGNFDEVHISQLNIKDLDGTLNLNTKGFIGNLRDRNNLTFSLPEIKLKASGEDISRITSGLGSISPQARNIITKIGNVGIDAAIKGHPNAVQMNGSIDTSLGDMDIDGTLVTNGKNGAKHFNGHLATTNFNVAQLLNKNDLIGSVAFDSDVDAIIQSGTVNGNLDGHFDYVDFKGRRIHDIDAHVLAKGNDYEGHIYINDTQGQLTVDGSAHLDGRNTKIDATTNVQNLNASLLGLKNKYANYKLSFDGDAEFVGNTLDNATGNITINNLSFNDSNDKGLHINNIVIDADNASSPQFIDITSDYLNGHISGNYNFKTVIPAIKSMLSQSFPQYFNAYTTRTNTGNDIQFDFTFEPDEELQDFIKLPVTIVHRSTIDGFIDEKSGNMAVNVNAPYLLKGNKIIEGTTLTARIDSATHDATLRATTLYPLKNGKVSVTLDANGINDHLDANLAWRAMRDRDYHGDINLSALINRDDQRRFSASIDINPTKVVFNDTAWQIESGRVEIKDKKITVDNFEGHNDNQWIHINGVASHDPDDQLCLELNDMSLDYVFETLNINNVDFGGRATGRFYASDLFSGAPRLSTPGLHVNNLSYNKAVMGDADIKSSWKNEEKAVSIYADLDQSNGKHSIIDGLIFVADDSLYLDFDADHANIAFMKPFMAAFTSDVQGQVSGHATLLGNFHTINLMGDIVADSLAFKLDYTNVTYSCAGDSVHIVPDYIAFNNVRIHDREGNEARFDGWLRHKSFHEPSFAFSITDADQLLCYDTNERINPVWYGTIYGNGAAFVTGEPGQVDIKVNMVTAPKSTFTFVMTDAAEASDYNFITFRDRDRKNEPEIIIEADTVPEIVRRLTQQAQKDEQSMPTHYNIDLQGDITPDAQLILVMDPIGGDRVKATGQGSMRMTYNDADEMTVYGTYTLERGNYNFTLQDIIIKDFTIRDGSSITFQGDPYAAILDLEAVYSLNANIRDLDESFSQDKEITRTNVPVHALLRAKGAIRQPEISFDLEFPTLTTDAYRKVKSIISTDDMMNRQIIYLLALNRFYTPEYNNNATNRGNELTSVASSTISSQLSNMLGKMSDKWTISPNFRSEKGDFSDMEVDLALSSQLLNNRLLLNGNFGYRDNTYNTRNSNFVGDFDIEYLLNPRGTLRLKAYNHFNDQNYYVRNALTTQGVGIVWKHDFDRPFDFINPKLKPTTTPSQRDITQPSDTVPVQLQNFIQNDSLQ
ncbi:MAG: translocation/assembly module TamB domain-containing protein [Muribaculaceae bacterium]|nr:translocation/assembly module TamB domain-containing protein [Muribaculaceae bacterium]